jgi:hypothetical protein
MNMTIDELLSASDLKPLPMRAWLEHEVDAKTDGPGASWSLRYRWVGAGEELMLSGVSLRLLDLGSRLQCLAIQGCDEVASEPDDYENSTEHAMVYLLNPADASVWDAIDDWLRVGYIESHGYGVLQATISPADLDALALRSWKDDELAGDLVTHKLLDLWERGQLEAVVKVGLGIETLLHCTIVETPRVCASLHVPLTQGERDAYDAHQANNFALEGIAS